MKKESERLCKYVTIINKYYKYDNNLQLFLRIFMLTYEILGFFSSPFKLNSQRNDKVKKKQRKLDY